MTAAALIYKSRVSIQSDTPVATNATLLTSEPGVAFTIHAEPQALKELMFMDGDSKAASLSDFRGKVVLLNIWATWCGPCRVEMPTLDRLQTMLGGPDHHRDKGSNGDLVTVMVTDHGYSMAAFQRLGGYGVPAH